MKMQSSLESASNWRRFKELDCPKHPGADIVDPCDTWLDDRNLMADIFRKEKMYIKACDSDLAMKNFGSKFSKSVEFRWSFSIFFKMKPGTEMEYKQGQTTLAIVENDNGPIYHSCEQVS